MWSQSFLMVLPKDLIKTQYRIYEKPSKFNTERSNGGFVQFYCENSKIFLKQHQQHEQSKIKPGILIQTDVEG